jgi:hypothetical protein
MTVKAIMKKYSNHWNNKNIPEKKFGTTFGGGKKF